MTPAQLSKTIAAQLQEAARLHQAGHLREAERLYDAVLKVAPKNADALNLKGLIALDQNKGADAIGLLRRAAAAAPSYPPIQLNLGNALAVAARPEEALGCYRKAITLNPAFADAHLNLGVLLEKLGRHHEAVSTFRTMISLCRNDARGFRNLALCLVEDLKLAVGDTKINIASEVGTAFERACTLDPADADSRFDYANVLAEYGDHANAVAFFDEAIKLRPAWVEAISNLGESLRKTKRPSEAIAKQRLALSLRPGDQNILTHLGNALMDTSAYDEAEQIFREFMAQTPQAILPYINLANVYRETNRPDEAFATLEDALIRIPDAHEAYASLATAFSDQGLFASADVLNKKALSIKAASPNIRLNQGLVALALGRFQEGWLAYETRFEGTSDVEVLKRPAPPPYWNGEDLRGKSILVYTEQGIGDEILYAGMIPDLVERAGRCVIACSKRMVPIFARSFATCTIVGYEESAVEIVDAPQCDYQTAVASLGQHLRPNLSSFPRHDGYLAADSDTVRDLRRRYEAMAEGRRIVGLAWRSSGVHGKAKSGVLMQLAPLLKTANVFFVNLQYGDCKTEIAEVAAQLGVSVYEDASIDPLKDMDAAFAQTAAMDLVITTSNTTAHTAGAQNIPVWVMLPFGRGALWYWFLRHPRSFWYPSAKLFRAPPKTKGASWWQEIIAPTAQLLSTWAATERNK